MKKRIYLLLIFFLLTGCGKSDNYASFKHYSLEGKDKINIYYYGRDKEHNTYIFTNIESNDFTSYNGLFYKVGDNDYILLDKVETCGDKDNYKRKEVAYFYDDKLYYALDCKNELYEYKLDGADTKKINFLEKTDYDIFSLSIQDVDSRYIYLRGREHFELDDREFKNFKCDRSSYKCEMIDS